MVQLKMAQSVHEAARLVEQVCRARCAAIAQGHVRVGPDVVKDPAFLVTRAMEDFVTWVDTSKIRRIIRSYEDKLDDFELLAE